MSFLDYDVNNELVNALNNYDVALTKDLLKSGKADVQPLLGMMLEKNPDDRNLRLIDLLLSYGADPNQLLLYYDTYMTTPLGWIIYDIANQSYTNNKKNFNYLIKIAKLLLLYGAKPFFMIHPDNDDYLYDDNAPDNIKENVLDVAKDIYPPLAELIEQNMDYYKNKHIAKTTLSYNKNKKFKQYEVLCKDLNNLSNLYEIREIAKIYGINIKNKDKATLCSEIAVRIHLL